MCSATGHADRRTAIRQTWGSSEAVSPLKVALVFALGSKAGGEAAQEAVHQEAEQFGDILQGDFEDTYMNLTLKSTMALKYVAAACGGGKKAPRFVMKTDDDIFINVPLLVSSMLKELKGAKRIITGNGNRN